MSNQSLVMDITEIKCSNEWGDCPSLARIEIDQFFLDRAESIQAALNANRLNEAAKWFAVACNLYECGDEGDNGAIVVDDEWFVPFEAVKGNSADLIVLSDGQVNIQMDVGDYSEYFKIELGTITELKAKLGAITGAVEEPEAPIPDAVESASEGEESTSQAIVISALKQALQNAHRSLRKSGFDMAEIDKALEMADQAKVRKPRVLVVVNDGMADTLCDPGVDVEVFDWYGHKHEEEGACGVPPRFADLATPSGIPVEGE